MKRIIVLFLILPFIFAFSLSDEEKARLSFEKAFNSWISGDPKTAYEIIKNTLYRPIDVRDIPKFWYLKARIEADLGMIEEAIKDLKNVLVIDPTSVEVVSYLKELEYLLQIRSLKREYKYKKLEVIEGIHDSIEYFYTIDDMALWGDTLYAIDRANKRLLVYKDATLIKTINLSFHPLSIEVSPWGEIFVSSTKGEIFSLENGQSRLLFKGLESALLAGFDRNGNLWGVSGFNVFAINKGSLKKYKLNESIAAMDCEITKEGVWILDTLHRRLALFDFKTHIITKDVPLYMDIRSFEVTPQGDFILLSSDGKIFVLKNQTELINTKITAPYAIGFEYKFPILVVADWHSHQMVLYTFSDGTPIIVKIDDMKYNEENSLLSLKFRVESIFGEPLPFANKFTYPVIDGSRVFYKMYFSPQEVLKYRSGIDFLSDRLQLIKRGKGYDILVPPDTYAKKEDIIPLRDKAIHLFVEGFTRYETLKWLAEMSGGGISKEGPIKSLRQFWIVTVPFTPGLLIKITPVSIYSSLLNEIFSDTVYFVERGTLNEGE